MLLAKHIITKLARRVPSECYKRSGGQFHSGVIVAAPAVAGGVISESLKCMAVTNLISRYPIISL
jgi:hypothetical protein